MNETAVNPGPTYEEIRSKGYEVQDKAVEARVAESKRGSARATGTYGLGEDSYEVMTLVQHIPAMFIAAASANPKQLEGVLVDLEKTASALRDNTIPSTVSNITEVIGLWDGDGVDALEGNFVDPLDQIRYNQLAVVETLIYAIDGYAQLLVENRKSVMKIAEESLAALEGSYNDRDPVNLEVAASIATIIVGIGITAATSGVGGVGVSLLGSAASGGLGFASGEAKSAVEEKGEPGGESVFNIGGDSVTEIVDSITDAMRKIQEDLAEEEEKIAKKLEGVLDDIDKDYELYIATRPSDLIGLATGDDPSKLTGDKGFGDPK